MIFNDKQITLKDGRTATLKSPCVEDAEKLPHYIKKTCGETDFLVRYPEEYQNTTLVQEEAWVDRLRSSLFKLWATKHKRSPRTTPLESLPSIQSQRGNLHYSRFKTRVTKASLSSKNSAEIVSFPSRSLL